MPENASEWKVQATCSTCHFRNGIAMLQDADISTKLKPFVAQNKSPSRKLIMYPTTPAILLRHKKSTKPTTTTASFKPTSRLSNSASPAWPSVVPVPQYPKTHHSKRWPQLPAAPSRTLLFGLPWYGTKAIIIATPTSTPTAGNLEMKPLQKRTTRLSMPHLTIIISISVTEDILRMVAV